MKEASSNQDKMAAYVDQSISRGTVLAIQFKKNDATKPSLIIPLSLNNGFLEYIALLPEMYAAQVLQSSFESILSIDIYDLRGQEFLKLVKNHKEIFMK